MTEEDLDRSDAADAKRFRWLLDGNGYFMEEQSLCGRPPSSDGEKDYARAEIDREMAESVRGKR